MPAEAKSRFVVDDMNLAGASFNNVNLGRARFTDINLSGACFDNINFTDAVIGENCNFAGMSIAGIPVKDLLAAYKERKKRG
jgi:uncharacterized protein YjbI with pentapeptide repeats